MEEVIRIFKEIQNTSGKNDKKKIIENNKNNELFKKCLVFLLDKSIVTGLSKKKLEKKVKINTEINTDINFQVCMDYLKCNNTGTDIDIARIQYWINYQPEEHREFYSQMVTKSLKLGCDAKTVNAAIPGLIHTFDVQLGTPIDKCKIPEGIWFSISHKLNGSRVVYYKGEFHTRQGKKYCGLDHIKNDLWLLLDDNTVVDGELVYKNPERLSDSDAFQVGVGIANSKVNEKPELKMVIFDVMTSEEFDKGISNDTYKVRKDSLNNLKNEIKDIKLKNVEVVNMFYEGTDQSEIWKWLDYAEENDLEGIILNLDDYYRTKRTKSLIKVKKFFDCDLKCINLEEGQGKYAGTLGAIICEYKGNIINVGSGFTDEQRNYYWNHPSEIIGKIVTVKYKEETKNKNGGVSLQFPVFQIVRSDKTEPSYN